MRQENLNLLPT